jgi:ATP-dependent Lon protease
VLIPDENVKDLAEIPDKIKSKLEIKPVKRIDEVLELALQRLPESRESAVVVEPAAQPEEESGSTRPH